MVVVRLRQLDPSAAHALFNRLQNLNRLDSRLRNNQHHPDDIKQELTKTRLKHRP